MKNKAIKRNYSIYVIITMIGLSVFAGCAATSQQSAFRNDMPTSSKTTPERPEYTNDWRRVCNMPPQKRNEWDKIWAEFNKSKIYRVANKDDFHFTEDDLRDGASRVDMEDWTRCPIRSQDFNGDSLDDYAVIIADTRNSSDTRLSLVIINVSSGGDVEKYRTNWVWHDQDLSQTYMSRSRDGLIVRDGSVKDIKNCMIRWNSKVNTYMCAPYTPH
jgi:hypothetical protein